MGARGWDVHSNCYSLDASVFCAYSAGDDFHSRGWVECWGDKHESTSMGKLELAANGAGICWVVSWCAGLEPIIVCQ